MGGALFLSEGFYERLHAGGEEFPARSREVREGRRSGFGGERGFGAIAQGFLRKGRTELQVAGRCRCESVGPVWIDHGISGRKNGGAKHVPDQSERRNREGLYGRETSRAQRASAEGFGRVEEKLNALSVRI